MRLESIRWAGIAGFAEEEVRFPADLAVVLGANGSGKTALLWMLRRIVGERAGDGGYDLDSGGAWAELVFANGDGRHRIRRDFLSGEAFFADLPDDSDAADDVPVSEIELAERWSAAVGPGTLELWLRSGVDPTDRAGEPSDWIASSREAGPGIVVDDPAAVLDAELRGLVGRPASGADDVPVPGALDMLREELAARSADLEAWADRATRLAALRMKRDELEGKRDEALRTAAAREETFENLRRFDELTTERRQVHENLKGIHEKRDLVKHAVEAVERSEKDLENRFGEFLNAGVDLEEALQTWSDATSRLHDAQRRSHLSRQALSSAPETHTRRNGTLAAAVLGGLAFLAALGAGAMSFGFILGPLVALLGFGGVWAKDRSVESMKRLKTEEIAALETEAEEAMAQIEDAKEKMGPLGKLGHPMAIRRSIVQYWKARDEVDGLRKRRDELPRLTDLVEAAEEAVQTRNILDAECRDLVSRAPYLNGMDASPASLSGEVDMARAQWEALQTRADRLEKECGEVTARMDELTGSAVAPGRLEADVADLRERLALTEQRARVLEIAAQAMREARDDYRANRAGRLCRRAGELLEGLTGGELKAVRFTESDAMELQTADGAWRPERRVSRASREQIAFAFRLAGLAEAPGGRTLPLVLDEPFARWDEDRLEACRRVLQRHTERGGQVVILSHRESLARWSGVAERLDGRHARALPEAA